MLMIVVKLDELFKRLLEIDPMHQRYYEYRQQGVADLLASKREAEDGAATVAATA